MDFEDLEALFVYQADHLTEQGDFDESEQPFYIPGYLETNIKGSGIQTRALDFYHNCDHREIMSYTRTSPRVDSNEPDNHSVAAIYNSTAFDLVRSE